jgi:hypothetical protein
VHFAPDRRVETISQKTNVIHGVSPSGFGWAHPSTKTICLGNCIILLAVGVRVSMLVHESFLLPTRLKGGGKVKGDINLGAKTKFKKVSPIEGRLFLEWFFFLVVKAYTVPPEFVVVVFWGRSCTDLISGRPGHIWVLPHRGFSISRRMTILYDYT